MKTKLTALLITVIMLVSLSFTSSAAHKYNTELAESITARYDTALELAGRSSFYGYCNLANAYQLRAWGIFKNGLDYSGTGKGFYDYFTTQSKTSGGYNVVTISGKNCLYDLVDKYGNEIYNVVYCLGTGGTSGPKHVLFIRAIIDGYVYFADSFNMTYGTEYYPEGTCTVRTIADFISAYKSMNGDPFGCVYFTNGKSEHLSGSVTTPDTDEKKEYTTGTYTVTASLLRIRDGADTQYDSLGLVPNGVLVTVTEIRDNWGKITYDGVTGWICLDYTEQETCDEETKNDIISKLLESDKSITFCGDTVTWTATVKGTSSKYFYAFYIYKDGKKVYSGTFSSTNTVSYVPDADGTYKATVEIMGDDKKITTVSSDDVFCLASKSDIVTGDANGDGKVTAADARKALRAAALIETLTGKNFVCADIDKDKKITASDARKILRYSSGLERDLES